MNHDKKVIFKLFSVMFIAVLAVPSSGQISCQKDPVNPLLVPDQAWEDSDIWGPAVLKLENKYYMGYCSSHSIGLATSIDGIHWERSSDNPVLQKGTAGTWEGSYVIHPNVLYEPDTVPPFKMWYTGRQSGYWPLADRRGVFHGWDRVDQMGGQSGFAGPARFLGFLFLRPLLNDPKTWPPF